MKTKIVIINSDRNIAKESYKHAIKKCVDYNNLFIFGMIIQSMTIDTLVVYAYYETSASSKNLSFFLKNGIVENAMYYIIINNHVCTVEIPDRDNINIFKKENSYDYDSYLFAVLNKKSNFKYYFFINDTCVGPFIPTWCLNNWIDIFKNKMIKENIDLIGPIIEIPPDSLGYVSINEPINLSYPNIPFIHTYMFGCTNIALDILIKEDCFGSLGQKISDNLKIKLVLHNERKITSCILLHGLKIGCLLTKYKNNTFANKEDWKTEKWNKTNVTCPEVPLNYDEIDVHPYEIIFVKNNRAANTTRNQMHSGISENLAKVIENYKKWL